MKKYNQYILFILFIVSVFVNVIYIINSIHYQTRTIKNDYSIIDENIVFFGDSITHGYHLKDYYTDTKLVNKGVKGDKTEDLIKRLDEVYTLNPSKVFILIGINDLSKEIEIDDIINNYSVIIKGIKENRRYAKIYVESVYPVNMDRMIIAKREDFYGVSNEQIIELNDRIRALCNEEEVTYINLYDQLTNDDGNLKILYTSDGVHISHLGYLKITSIIEKYIKD